jgi:branched-chain amino acid transport system ATP-binding protein
MTTPDDDRAGPTARSDQPILETVRVTKRFGDHTAVRAIDLQVTKGSVHAAIGPNGAGKTTLFNILTGIYRPDEGAVLFRGKDITNVSQPDRVRMGLARCFQKTNILRRLSVFENVYLAALRARAWKQRSWRSPRDWKRQARELTDQILERVGLSVQRNREAQTVPYGYQRLLDVGMALACQPEVLLLDEMTSGLSAGEIDTAMDLIRQLATSQTILLIEHNMNLVMNVAQKITVINFGEVIAEGRPEMIKLDPRVQEAYFGGIL